MYKSPIEVIVDKIKTQHENDIYKAVQEYGIYVDKEELIKALQYDRDQYDRGYQDAVLKYKKEGKWTLNDDGSGTCNRCGRTQKNV